ncbi:hypothetical protein J3A83DRAFT_4454256 [Scleroderma citrinum]
MGILTSKNFDPDRDIPDLTGKVILITGGNAGIGYATVKHLARKGAKVYMAARNKARAEAAIADLQKEGLGPGNGEVVWLELDLSDPRNAKNAAREFMNKEDRLDVLSRRPEDYGRKVGPQTLPTPDSLTPTHFSLISPFVLTRELLPILKKTASHPDSDVRIIVVSSDGHKLVGGKPRFQTIEDLNHECKNAWLPGFARYCQSKLTNVLYTSELHRRLSSSADPAMSNITALSLHPGTVNTIPGRPEVARLHLSTFVFLIGYPISVVPDIGAYNSVFAAASPIVKREKERFGGGYLVPVGRLISPGGGLWQLLFPGQEKEEEKQWEWGERGKELWETIERFLEERGI